MKFKRLDDVTVRCIITEEDLHEYNVNIDDFLNSKEKTHDFLHEIVERAAMEVGFKPQKGMLSMKVMALPRNGLAITFSESNKEDLDGILEHLGDIVKELGDVIPDEFSDDLKDMSKKKKIEILDKFMKGLIQDAAGEYEEEQYLKQNKEQKSKKRVVKNLDVQEKRHSHKVVSTLRIYVFDSLKYIERFSKMISNDLNVISSLYKSKESHVYYLIVEKGLLSDSDFDHVCNIAMEYGKLESHDAVRFAYLKEHYECIIGKNAIHIIKAL